MTQAETARRFAALHVKGDPVVLYNIWDAGSARAVAEAGAQALATGSWSVAGAQGFKDGQAIPLELLETIVARIAAVIDVPLTVDFEGAYAEAPAAVADNVARIVGAGAIGINFEDQVVGGDGLYDIEQQCARIAAVRSRGEELGVPLFINARTDLFLKMRDRAAHPGLMDEAKARGAAYLEAGASGFFVPGLVDEGLIADVCEAIPAPVNVMMLAGAPPVTRLAELGVSRVSYGPGPFVALMGELTEQARAVYGTAAD